MITIFCKTGKSAAYNFVESFLSVRSHMLSMLSSRYILSNSWELPIRLLMIFAQKQTVLDLIRKWCLYLLMFLLTCNTVLGKIRNGYEKDINNFRQSCKNLHIILAETSSISTKQRRKIESMIKTLEDQISYYELTEVLLNQFRRISFGIYNEIDTITDRLGRPVDVFVKFVPSGTTEVKASGTTYLSQIENDKDGYNSEYGEFTVSVKIWITNRGLLVLAHELGHVKYQVPNLASYIEFHKSHYSKRHEINFIGHDTNDPSGKSATHFGRIFWRDSLNFYKTTNEKIHNPLDMLARIKRDINTAIVLQ